MHERMSGRARITSYNTSDTESRTPTDNQISNLMGMYDRCSSACEEIAVDGFLMKQTSRVVRESRPTPNLWALQLQSHNYLKPILYPCCRIGQATVSEARPPFCCRTSVAPSLERRIKHVMCSAEAQIAQ
jgi:hypothetical protein